MTQVASTSYLTLKRAPARQQEVGRFRHQGARPVANNTARSKTATTASQQAAKVLSSRSPEATRGSFRRLGRTAVGDVLDDVVGADFDSDGASSPESQRDHGSNAAPASFPRAAAAAAADDDDDNDDDAAAALEWKSPLLADPANTRRLAVQTKLRNRIAAGTSGPLSSMTLTPARSAAILRLRAQYGLDAITTQPQPYYHLLKECHPCYFHGCVRTSACVHSSLRACVCVFVHAACVRACTSA